MKDADNRKVILMNGVYVRVNKLYLQKGFIHLNAKMIFKGLLKK